MVYDYRKYYMLYVSVLTVLVLHENESFMKVLALYKDTQ